MALIFTSEPRVAQCAGMEVMPLILLVEVHGKLDRVNSLTSPSMGEICMLEQTSDFVNMYCQQ